MLGGKELREIPGLDFLKERFGYAKHLGLNRAMCTSFRFGLVGEVRTRPNPSNFAGRLVGRSRPPIRSWRI